MTFQVIDAERNPLPNVQVHYGISNPETFGFIGFTDKNDSVAWNDLLTGKQNIYVWIRLPANCQCRSTFHSQSGVLISAPLSHYRRSGKLGKTAQKPRRLSAQ
ncbi:MAG: hypothetical protein E6123_03160 [Clostridiales bacterium]|nr:hypothetical protein [Clostridiales bacterium]